METYPYTVTMPPSKNRLYRNVSDTERRYFGGRGRRKTREYKVWRDQWTLRLRAEFKFPQFPKKTKTVWGLSRANLYFKWLEEPKGRAPDPFNCFTPLVDLISDVIGVDDNIRRLMWFGGWKIFPAKKSLVEGFLLTWEDEQAFNEWIEKGND